MNYKTAQNVGVFPKNDPFLVSEVCQYLNLDENQIWVWEGELEDKIKLPFPSNISTREILETFCDFQGQVMKKTLKDLAKIYRKQHQQNENLSQKIEFLADSNFKLPENRKNNVIMVGAGTGVAPFIGFCQEKECLQDQFGKFTLFFGCRKADSDFIFKNQINEFINKGVLDKFYAAFSRDQEFQIQIMFIYFFICIQKNKIYVQDKILENQDIVYEDIFQNNAVIYICGSTYMGNAVINILKKIISNKQQINDQEAQQKIKQLESSSKIIKELW
ncbi:hypothetical protein IMG5_151380 [Ichthyophthirius multifiliis]|uniref:NADPH--hemoprotein reductase n=1 Tax=Ichthyophthirius multifiliis TaxID=5932 RepID=G0QYP1_ICHMU|nr:hypothetical protein IMG5_151380 [Ichthyophthirius multifiliis]EGR29669.1 hypothetical protein IMG5_151380 [Ichthyophthirius multifiliis]|eukprot:XP_004030905.1 hypothetical protein IMG5_151380 [Ichthyophthirius multifiliis]